MPRGELSNERFKVDGESYSKYNDLPLVHTGCDSYASWDPRFKHLSPVLDSNDITEAIIDTLPHKEWKDEHLVITGGEPLLGWQRAFPDLLDHPKMAGLTEITFETNGTQPLTEEFKKYLSEWSRWKNREITFSVSAKLPCSGEKWEDAIIPEVVVDYETVGTAYLKFVIATEEDYKDAECAIAAYRKAGFKGHVYLMPVGGTEQLYSLNNRAVAEIAMRNGYRYSDRLQIPLFKNAWGT
jgi:organic radical activating enzyme